jgi:hypothetical protein
MAKQYRIIDVRAYNVAGNPFHPAVRVIVPDSSWGGEEDRKISEAVLRQHPTAAYWRGISWSTVNKVQL